MYNHPSEVTQPGYFLEDIHMLKNGQDFDIGKLFSFPPFAVKFSTIYSQHVVSSSSSSPYDVLGPCYLHKDNQTIKYDAGSTSALDNVIVVVSIGDAAEPEKAIKSFINIQFHDTLTEVYLGPETMEMALSGLKKSFAVFAEFGDGIVANISAQARYQTGFSWSKHSDAASFVAFAEAPEATTPTVIQRDGTFQVTASLPANTPNPRKTIELTLPTYLQYTAKAIGRVHFTAEMPATVKCVSGAVNLPLDKGLNVLFLSEGYQASESAKFDKQVEAVVGDLRTGQVTEPWTELSKKANFWSYFVPSVHSSSIVAGDCIKLGSSSKYIDISNFIKAINIIIGFFAEVLDSSSAVLTSSHISLVKQNTKNANYEKLADEIDWSLAIGTTSSAHGNFASFVEQVGLPMSWNNDHTLIQNQDRWSIIHNTPPVVSLFTFGVWKLMYSRRALDHPDTVFNVASGPFHRSKSVIFSGVPNFAVSPAHALKIPVSFYQFMRTFKYEKNENEKVGEVFFDADGKPVLAGAENNENLRSGYCVVYLSKHPTVEIKAENTATSDDEAKYVVFPTDHEFNQIFDTEEFDYGIYTPPKRRRIPKSYGNEKLGYKEISTAVHELSHVWLLDEYSGTGGNAELQIFPANYDFLNLQRHRSVLFNQKVNGSRIKWSWPRIQKIALIGNGLGPTGTEFAVSISDESPLISTGEHAEYGPFQKDECVILRNRRRGIDNTYPVFKIINIDEPEANTSGPRVLHLKYQDQNATFKNNEFEPDSGLQHSEFANGRTLLIKPLWDDASNYTRFHSLVHHAVTDLITVKQEPLVADSISGIPDMIQKPDKKFTSSGSWPKGLAHQGLAVGLYAGGLRYSSGIYHGSGICLMRNAHTPVNPENGKEMMATSYMCPVCAYIVVDAVDFTKHPQNDIWISKRYPKI